MNTPPAVPLTLAAICAAALAGCQTAAKRPPTDPAAKLRRELSESQALVRRYEERYGKLLPERPKHDFRKLRADLKGKPMKSVEALLGKPDKVYSIGTSESWDYTNVAYDPVSGRTVRGVEIWFRNGAVEYVKSSF